MSIERPWENSLPAEIFYGRHSLIETLEFYQISFINFQ